MSCLRRLSSPGSLAHQLCSSFSGSCLYRSWSGQILQTIIRLTMRFGHARNVLLIPRHLRVISRDTGAKMQSRCRGKQLGVRTDPLYVDPQRHRSGLPNISRFFGMSRQEPMLSTGPGLQQHTGGKQRIDVVNKVVCFLCG
jgi:hypothetical protein